MPMDAQRRDAVVRWSGLSAIGAFMVVFWWWFARRYPESGGIGWAEICEVVAGVLILGCCAQKSPPSFPVLRWFGAVFLAVLVPCYWVVWGGPNFMQLCDIALFLTVLGWWTGNSLLVSSQILAVLVIHLLWCLDAGMRVATGFGDNPRFLLGGGALTAYMWMDAYSLFVRLLSLFHVFWVPLMIVSVRKVGYDRRSLAFQAAVAMGVMILTLYVAPHFTTKNVNFVFKSPLGDSEPFKPPALHMLVTWIATVAVLYAPGHFLLVWLFRAPSTALPPPQETGGTAVA